jgi:hypothetical protein
VVGVLLASAGAGPQLLLGADLPFSEDELAAALALRWPPASDRGAGSVDVRRGEVPGQVEIAVAGRRRAIELDDLVGPAAARRVALAAIDLAAAGPELPEARRAPVRASPVEPRGEPGGPASPGREGDPEAGARASRVRHTLELGAYALGGVDSSLPAALWTAALEVSLAVAGPLRAAFSAGYSAGPSAAAYPFGLTEFPLRAQGALRFGPLELRAGPALVPYRLSGSSSLGPASHAGALAAFGGAAAFLLPVIEPFEVLALAGGDAYLQPVEFRVLGRPILSTGRAGAWAGLGVRFGVSP